ncbi:hypothetical protein [Vibrio parahaemolyticus]|uniref:hypothetical protein n=1 Tax=Vibrio parahaemolyticus TaxID=670 RepID=UPI002361996B|nr:hypothetical protein [Vibrio parahaemolyticus]
MNNKNTYVELLKISIKLDAFTQSLNEEIGRLKALAELQEPEPQKVKPRDKEFYGTNIL